MGNCGNLGKGRDFGRAMAKITKPLGIVVPQRLQPSHTSYMQKPSPKGAPKSVGVNKPRPKTIHRKHLSDNFVTLPNALVQDKTLSFRATGILVMMLSMPQDWLTHQKWIESQRSEGREAVRASVRELEAAGYLTRNLASKDNRLLGYEWHWHAVPVAVGQRTSLSRVSDDGKPSADFPPSGKPARTKYPSEKVPNGQETETKEPKGTPPDGECEVFPDFPAIWTPSSRTKAQKLARIQPDRANTPTEDEFYDLIEREELDWVINYRSSLYDELTTNKFHQWKDNRWIPIRDWPAYIRSLDGKIGETFER